MVACPFEILGSSRLLLSGHLDVAQSSSACCGVVFYNLKTQSLHPKNIILMTALNLPYNPKPTQTRPETDPATTL